MTTTDTHAETAADTHAETTTETAAAFGRRVHARLGLDLARLPDIGEHEVMAGAIIAARGNTLVVLFDRQGEGPDGEDEYSRAGVFARSEDLPPAEAGAVGILPDPDLTAAIEAAVEAEPCLWDSATPDGPLEWARNAVWAGWPTAAVGQMALFIARHAGDEGEVNDEAIRLVARELRAVVGPDEGLYHAKSRCNGGSRVGGHGGGEYGSMYRSREAAVRGGYDGRCDCGVLMDAEAAELAADADDVPDDVPEEKDVPEDAWEGVDDDDHEPALWAVVEWNGAAWLCSVGAGADFEAQRCASVEEASSRMLEEMEDYLLHLQEV